MDKYIYIKKDAEDPIIWIEKYCVHYIGAKKDQAFLLDDWQKEICRNIFGWRLRSNTLYFKHTTVWLEIPRGNGKSTFATALGLYIAFGMGIESSKVYCFASSREQSKESVFDPAKHMAESINERFDVGLRLLHNTVKDPETKSDFKLMSADWKGAHSLVGSGFIIDEIHLHTNSKLFEGVQSGDAKRTDIASLMIICTTSGERGTFGYEKHLYAKAVLEGRKIDESWLVYIFSAGDKPKGDDDYYFRAETWKKANPGYDYINQYKFENKANAARQNPSDLNPFLRYNLNIWVGSTESWIPTHDWSLGDSGVPFSDVRGMDCYGGMMVSVVRDIGALCLYSPSVSQFFWWYWCPSLMCESRKSSTAGFADWLADGYIISVRGHSLRDDPVVNRIKAIAKNVNIKLIRYNGKEATSKVQLLEDSGVEMEPQSITSFGDMSAPAKEIEKRILEGSLLHGGNPVSQYMIESTQMSRQADMIRPDAGESKDNICGVYAAIMAMGGWMNEEPEEESISLSKGIISIDL